MKSRFFQFFQGFSLDVAMGGMVFSMAIHPYFEVEIYPPAIMALGACIWLIYSLDHLMDARHVNSETIPMRYQLHRQYAHRILFVMVVIIVLLAILTIFFLPFSIQFYGGMMLGFVVCYFLITHGKFYIQKELLVALGYTLGIVLVPLSLTAKIFSFQDALLLGMIFLLAYINVLLFAKIEENDDRRLGFESAVTKYGCDFTQELIRLVIGVFCLVWAVWVYFDQYANWLLSLILFAMCAVLWLLWKFPRFHQQQVYRAMGDGIFFLPGILLFFG